jgi:hypothetical protein
VHLSTLEVQYAHLLKFRREHERPHKSYLISRKRYKLAFGCFQGNAEHGATSLIQVSVSQPHCV